MQIAFEIETQQCQTKKGKEQTNYFMRFQSECILLTCSSLEDYCFSFQKKRCNKCNTTIPKQWNV